MERSTSPVIDTPRHTPWKIVETACVLRPFMSWVHRWRQVNIIFIVIAYLIILLAALGPTDVVRNDRFYVYLWYIAFVCRTGIFHLGLLCGMVTGCAMGLRQYRLAAGTIPLLMVTLLPSVLAAIQPMPSVLPPSNFRVMSFNAYWHNANSIDGIAEISRYAPDVVVIQECSLVWQRDLPIKLRSQYPYIYIGQQRGSYSSAILSKFPIIGKPERYSGHRPMGLPAVQLTLDVRGQKVALYNVHLFRPVPGRIRQMRKQLRVLRAHIENKNMPVIVAGDFNFTALSKMHEAMLSSGLTDAHDAVGVGRGTTWPKTSSINWLPGFRIDHVYTSQAFQPCQVRIGIGAGSDHRPVVVDLNLREVR